jgi:hypothetical protein
MLNDHEQAQMPIPTITILPSATSSPATSANTTHDNHKLGGPKDIGEGGRRGEKAVRRGDDDEAA